MIYFFFFFSSACFTVPGPEDPSFISFKSSLHDFCQKYKLPPPQYITNQGTNGYSAKLKFGGLFFQSSSHFTARIEAEQHAAFEALQGLGLLESAVEFEAANLSNGMLNTSVATINSSTHNQSTNSYSRQNSRGAGAGSRVNSRPPSRPGSRQGSMNQLNLTNQSFDNYRGADTSYNSNTNLSSRSYSTSTAAVNHHNHNTSSASISGYDVQHGVNNRHEQYDNDNAQHNQVSHQQYQQSRNGSIGGQSAVSLTSTPRQHQQSQPLPPYSHEQTVTGYEEGSGTADVYAFSYSNYNGSSTTPRASTRSQSQSYQDYDDADFADGSGSASTAAQYLLGGNNHNSNAMHYEQNSRASSGYATMPRKHVTANGTSYVQVRLVLFNSIF